MEKTNTHKRGKSRFLRFVLILFVLLVLSFVYFLWAIYLPEPAISDTAVLKQEVQVVNPQFRKLGQNWLKQSESGLWEMYLEGDAFERGVINGKLTKDLAEYQETVFINQINELVPSENYLKFLKYFVAYFNRNLPEHIPVEYLQEIYGVSLSASDKYDHLAPKYYRILNYHSAHDIGHALQDKNMTVGCTSFGAWNKKTKNGQLLIGRNFDFFAGDNFAKNKIVCFTKPKQGHAFMYVTWAGFTGVVSGMNDKGLTVTINAAKSEIPSSAATPISLLVKEILQYAQNIEEAYRIAQSRQTFVSESILIGSSRDHRCAIIEKTPGKTNLYSEKGDQLVCSNHYNSDVFRHDYFNAKNIVESSSFYRQVRMKQLLAQHPVLAPEDAAAILRDQNGINNTALGLTNEKGMNQLLAHHSVIFQPEAGLVWVSCSPYQLGKYVCYDLKKVFEQAPGLSTAVELQDSSKTIAQDPFLSSSGYRDFLRFKQLKYYLQYCTKSRYALRVSPEHLQALVDCNPESYLSYQLIGDYYAKMGETEKALVYYKKALSKEVATGKEADQIAERIKELSQR